MNWLLIIAGAILAWIAIGAAFGYLVGHFLAHTEERGDEQYLEERRRAAPWN